MIDIHTHILPKVDDGPRSWEESLHMLRLAEEAGTRTLVATSHQPGGWRGPRPPLPAVYALVEELNARARSAGIGVQVVPGAEIYLTARAAELIMAGELPTLNGTHYVLVEFGFDSWPDDVERSARRLVEAGYRPVIAHPERYRLLQHAPDRVHVFLEMGCLLQINAGSLTGRFGREALRLADWLFTRGLVHCVASDAHNASSRPPALTLARQVVASRYGQAVADQVTCSVPAAIVDGRDVAQAVRRSA